MGKYSVPEKIRKQKPKHTIVKKIGNHYYVYSYTYYKDKNGKWQTKPSAEIGKITEEHGFVPNSNYSLSTDITTLEYGQYAVTLKNTEKVINRLLEVFNPIEAYTLYYISVIHFVNEFQPVKNIKKYVEQSCLSLLSTQLSFSSEKITKLLDTLGRRQTNVWKYEQKCIEESSGQIIVDGHVMSSASHQNDLAMYGNKYAKLGDTQLNVLMVYDLNNNTPLVSKIYPGNLLDKVSVQDLLQMNQYKDMLFVVDRGFYSSTNIKLFSSNGNHYIIPLSQNLRLYKKATNSMKFHQTFIYENNKKRAPIDFKEIKENGKRIIVYRDNEQYVREKTDYLKNMQIDPKKYTQETYDKVSEFFGVIVLQTNLNNSAEEIFKLYKKRWKIETFFDYFKNKIDIKNIYLNNYYKIQGLGFVMLLVSQIYEELKKNTKHIKGKSVEDILLEARLIKLNQYYNNWTVTNTTKEMQEFMQSLNVDLLSPLK